MWSLGDRDIFNIFFSGTVFLFFIRVHVLRLSNVSAQLIRAGVLCRCFTLFVGSEVLALGKNIEVRVHMIYVISWVKCAELYSFVRAGAGVVKS